MSVTRHATLRRIESTRLIGLALPILGAQLAQVAMGTVDVAMTGHASARDLAAVSVGSSLWLPLVLFMIGTLMGLTPIVAQHVGARRFGAIRPAVHQALWVAAVLGVACALGVRALAAPVFTLMSVPEDVATLALRYLDGVALGLPAIALYETLRFYSDGMGHTRASLQFALLGLAVNIVANYGLIHGGDGLVALFGADLPAPLLALPALGAAGCGIATAISMWTMFVAMFCYTRLARVYARARFGAAFSWPVPALIGELLRVGLPVGVAIFAEVSLFTVIALFLAGYGEIVIAAHTVALNFSSVLFMLPLSLGMALTVRVGQALGRGKYRHARFVAFNGVACALAAAFVIDLIIVLGAPWAVSLYTGNAEIQRLAVQLLLIATLYQFSDALQVSIAGALRGYKDTRIIMIVTLVSYWGVGVGLGNLLGRGVAGAFEGLGVYGYWIGLIAGLSVAAALLGRRLVWVSQLRRLSASGP
ncbi:MATE family efflux transporter [Salinisphaera orenii]|uniref:Multidrug-efflux transporter n=1 Tax=Salinisphaera orenii YIM 95161 TaxID=1051139 RepID=A0A423PFR7_9GAMM|nr:MATE family efflux transporter [Salinisphaera halophila]ROO24420.1 multidrug transporter MATE [Salinisphaera halophila YIM 95161]